MVLGSLIIQQRMGFSDRELVKQIQENPYYQYFIGHEAFQHTPPFEFVTYLDFHTPKGLLRKQMYGIFFI